MSSLKLQKKSNTATVLSKKAIDLPDKSLVTNASKPNIDSSLGIVFKVKPSANKSLTKVATNKQLKNTPTNNTPSKPVRLSTPQRETSSIKASPKGSAKPSPTTSAKPSPRSSVSVKQSQVGDKKPNSTATSTSTTTPKIVSNRASSTTIVSASTQAAVFKDPTLPAGIDTFGRHGSPVNQNEAESIVFFQETFGSDREQVAVRRYESKLKTKVIEAFIRSIVHDRREVREKRSILDILQTKRLLDAWHDAAIDSSHVSEQQNKLALEYSKVRYL